jgi:hypothetical protein
MWINRIISASTAMAGGKSIIGEYIWVNTGKTPSPMNDETMCIKRWNFISHKL